MKAKALQFGKAMSAALFGLLLVAVGTKNALAQNLVATLQHGDSISMYYGASALAQAHNAAQTGDIITLSSGTFNPTTLTKAITLRGAGCCMDTVTGINPTIIGDPYNTMEVNISDEEHTLIVEGIWAKVKYSCLKNSKFIKCNLTPLFQNSSYNSPTLQNAQFVDCMVDAQGRISSNSTNIQFTNCYVRVNNYDCTASKNVSFLNSVVKISGTPIEVMAVNSIFYNGGILIPTINASASLFHNCVSIRINGLFDDQSNTTNLEMDSYSDVFETYDGNDNVLSGTITERFILNSDFATSFLGNDGTEVGLYGGLAPYNPRPNYMVLKQCNVASQSTVDNKLSVEIQVVAEGE
jgi:hypothetical protein